MSQPRVRFPIGISDFRNVREDGFYYVDKTALIDDVLNESAQVLLAPRPRRFGKTLNLSMLRYFFEKSAEDRRPLFDGLAVASSGSAWAHFQRYPVIFMTFKDVKPRSWEDCLAGMMNVLAEAYGAHRYLLTEGNLYAEDAQLFTAVLEHRAAKSELVIALKLLSRLLAKHHGEKVVILIDEYDTPIHAGYTNTYYDDVVAFFRDFLSGGLKDNVYLFKGILTGILRVAKESLFLGLNNIRVYSFLRTRLATAFGFTEAEVRGLASAAGQAEVLDGIRAHYNGYLFGGQAIYNPWSVLSFLDSEDNVFRPYWIETSSNDLVRELLLTGPRGVQAGLETLLAGGTLVKRIDENIVLRDIAGSSDAIWSFLLFTGYLKALSVRFVEDETEAELVVQPGGRRRPPQDGPDLVQGRGGGYGPAPEPPRRPPPRRRPRGGEAPCAPGEGQPVLLRHRRTGAGALLSWAYGGPARGARAALRRALQPGVRIWSVRYHDPAENSGATRGGAGAEASRHRGG